MTVLLAFSAGLLTILSPCILPLLAGMAVTFASVGVLAVVGGGWAVRANQLGRLAALTLLALFGLAMLFPFLADRLMQPLVGLGQGLSRRSEQARSAGFPVGSSALLGVAVGLLWAPASRRPGRQGDEAIAAGRDLDAARPRGRRSGGRGIALGLDQASLASLQLADTNRLEQALLSKVRTSPAGRAQRLSSKQPAGAGHPASFPQGGGVAEFSAPQP